MALLLIASEPLPALVMPEPTLAYIGPGAGFAVGTTLLTLLLALFSAVGALCLWPIHWIIRVFRQRRALARARVRRVVILGLDGLDPNLIERYLAEGKLPNFARLREQGSFLRLGTTLPPLSPVAWSSFLTSCNPGKHHIFDFLTRDPQTYRPALSSVHISGPRRSLKLGRYRISLGPPDIRLLRKGKPFWNVLGEHGIFSNILRVPITFPPEKFRGVLLSAMCVPDLRGSQGTFSYYSTAAGQESEYVGGEQIRVRRENNIVRAELIGPEHPRADNGGPLHCPFEVRIAGPDRAVLKLDGQTVKLKSGEYTSWLKVPFQAGWGAKIHGICQFLLIEAEPEFRLYVTPIQIDPDRPVLPISHPGVYATYLSKLLGTYATLGLAEDTWGLNGRVLDDAAFLHQVLEADRDRENMLTDALDKVRRGLCVCVVDGSDRIQHMFWRYIDPQHPARDGQGGREERRAIEEMYARMDRLVGDTLARCEDEETVVMVISDHGFSSFRRGVDLNCWLEQNGYLKLLPEGRGRKYLAGVDWSQTKAYAIGLAGVWLNIRGREAQGIVDPAEAEALREELRQRLAGLQDEEKGVTAINRVFNTRRIYRGPYGEEAPDLIIGYNQGYRVCWEAAVGQPTERLFHDNTKAWSGDHCIDPALVPGILFCNRKIASTSPHLMDLGATVLDLFGVPVPAYMDGRPLMVADANGTFPTARSGSEKERMVEALPTALPKGGGG